MRKRNLLMKMLLVTAMLCVGSNAWAQGYKRILDEQNYESASKTDWIAPGNGESKIISGDATYGKYSQCNFTSGAGNNRSTTKRLTCPASGLGYTTAGMTTKGYNVEFDVSFKSGSNNDRTVNQFIASTTNSIDDNSSYNGTDYIFSLSTTKNSTTWYINDLANSTGNTISIGSTEWCHVKLIVTASSVSYTITNKATSSKKTGSLSVSSMPTFRSFYVLLGYNNAEMRFDNLEVYDYTNLPSTTYSWGQNYYNVVSSDLAMTVSEGPTVTNAKLVEGTNYFVPSSDGGTTAATSENVTFYFGYDSGDTSKNKYWTLKSSGMYAAYSRGSADVHIYNLAKNQIIRVYGSALCTGSGVLTALTDYDDETEYIRYYQANSDGTGVLSLSRTVYLYSIDVFTPDPITVAIIDVKANEPSAAFATYIDGLYDGGTLTTVAKVYEAHTAWQIAQAKSSGSTDLTKVIRNAAIVDATDWDGATILSGEKYMGAPDDNYLDKNTGSIDASQTIYGLPAGKYVLKAATRSKAGTTGNIYVYAEGQTNTNTAINAVGNTGGTLDRGWSWTEVEFTLTATSDVKIGFWANTTDYWASCDDFHLTLAGESATITAAGWSTFASPYALDLSTISGGTAYYASAASGSTVTLTSTTQTVQAGEGIMVKGTAGETFTIGVAASGTAISGNLLKGQTTTGDVAASTDGTYHYVFGFESASKYGFYNLTAATSVAAGKAYLETTSALTSGGSRLSIVFDDEVTGINDVKANMSDGRGEYFNLQGQRVDNPKKGLYIVNGMKINMK